MYLCVCACMLICFSCVWLCNLTDCSSPGFSVHGILQAKYWSGLPCSPPGDLPGPVTKPMSLMSPVLAGGFFTTSTTWEAHVYVCVSMYRCAQVCVYVHVYIYKCVYMGVCISMYTCVYMLYVYAYVYGCVYVCICVCVSVWVCLQFLLIDHPITETLLLIFLVGGPEMVCEEWLQWDLSCTFQWQSFVASHPSEGPDHDLSVPHVDSQGWRLAGLSSNCIFPLPWLGITA